MIKKILLQFFLFFLILIISLIVFKMYFLEKKVITYNENETKKEIIKSNVIHNIKYNTQDNDGNKYNITADKGEFENDNPELIFMTNVNAIIKLDNSTPINVSSDEALYNNITHETKFSNSVLITYIDHHITSANLDLILEKNLVTIYNDVIYKNLNTKLLADKVEIDLITKNSKIFMIKNQKKIKIISTN
jgi:hypothetical protein